MALMEQSNKNNSLILTTANEAVEVTIKKQDVVENYNTSIASCKNRV